MITNLMAWLANIKIMKENGSTLLLTNLMKISTFKMIGGYIRVTNT